MSIVTVFYDGDCPLCANYAKAMRVRESVTRLNLIDLRQDTKAKIRWQSAGYDLDEGFIVEVDDVVYSGSKGVHILAMLSSRGSLFNRINAFVFSKPWLSKILYPVLVRGRLLLLWLLGRRSFRRAEAHANKRAR